MTLRLDDQDMQALREHADLEHRSMQQVAILAIRHYIAERRHQARVEEVGSRVIRDYREALDRLGDS